MMRALWEAPPALVLDSRGAPTVVPQFSPDGDALAFLGSLVDATIAGRVEQHPYSQEVFPHSANSIRIITMWDYGEHEPFVVCAVHRFGTTRSMPADNSGLGGVFCRVDVPTGTLEKLHVGRQVGDVEPFDHHPDTGVKTTGLTIPAQVS